ncbi:hypothetical protein [Nocardioides dilutus]
MTRVGVASRWRWAIFVVAAFNALGSLGGAVGLISGWLTLGDYTEKLPFDSLFLAGSALAVLVFVPQAVLTVLAFRRSRATASASVVAGSVLVGWILLEVVILHVFAGLQVFYLIVGLVQVGLGLLLGEHDRGSPAGGGPRERVVAGRPGVVEP